MLTSKMPWLLHHHYITAGVILGLFISICLYKYKKKCMDGKCGKKDETLVMKELFTLDRELGKRVDTFDEELLFKDSYSTYASKTTFKLDTSRRSFCACKPGDKESCIDAWF